MEFLDEIRPVGGGMSHLHVHSTKSLLDGANKIDDYVARVKELGMTSCAITDHNHIGGWLEFKDECESQGIKPIFGCEMYQTWDMNIVTLPAKERRELAIKSAQEAGIVIPEKIDKKKITQKQIDEYIKDFVYDTKQYHIIVLAMNQTGLQNLIKLQSEAAEKGLYNGRYCCDFGLLEKYNEGLIITSACLGGMIPNLIIKNREEEAKSIAMKYQSIFGDRFYIELQPLLDPAQTQANEVLVRFAKELGVSLVATNDVHYTYKEDNEDHDTLLCIGIGKKKSDEDRMRYPHEFWVRSYDEMMEAFQRHSNYSELEDDFITAINNTLVVSDRIEDNLSMGSPVPLFPKVTVPRGMTPESYLTVRSYENLYKYLKKNPVLNRIKYQKRLVEELNVINTKGFAPYMLATFEIVDHCKQVDIPVGPGRGSAAGSLVLFVNGGTKVADPIKYDLLFFRFLTMDRKDLPDVDSDFGYYGRPKLIKWLEETHGTANVCNIGTWTELGVKSGLKDFGRVLDIDFMALNNITKEIDIITDEVPGFKFKDFEKFVTKAEEAKEENDLTTYSKYMSKYAAYTKIKEENEELFRIAIKFEGTPRNMGCHASGVLVSPVPINDFLPTRCDKEGNRITLLTGPQVERMNFVKLDILGLKTLDVLDKTVKQINPDATVEDLYDMIPGYLDNKNMFAPLLEKETEGLFQIESNLFKSLCEEMMLSNFDDVCAALAIGRPGPLSANMHTAYANRKKGLEEATEQLRGTGHITKDTYNTIIYQEQCMLIGQHVAGFDDSQSDSIIRKALAKKKKDMMELARRSFIYGKLNIADPTPDSGDINRPYYDPKAKYGSPILGGTNNGWTEKELSDFWETLKGYASYLFNKSHSQSYAVITLLTMYLKTNYKSQFFASLLSMQSTSEKVDLYSKTARDYGIYTGVPDINNSSYDFTEHEGRILYGFKSIKGIGDGPIEELIANRPYSSLQDMFDKVPKKAFNKKVGVALIKAGALDSFNTNRHELLNEFMDIRKDKDDRYIPNSYDENICMEFEREILSTCITYVPWIDTIQSGDKFEQEFELVSCGERPDKKGNMMGFAKLKTQGMIVDALVFSRTYCNNVQAFDVNRTAMVVLKGKKDGTKLIISSVVQTTSHSELSIMEDIVL